MLSPSQRRRPSPDRRCPPGPHAVRHHRAAVRQRPVPHRPHHGVHPGRHLGALPADAGQRRAFRLRRRHPRRADHAEGRSEGITPEELIARVGRVAPRRLEALPHQLRHDFTRPIRPRTSSCAGHLPRARRRAASSRRRRSSSSTTRSRACSCPTATSRATARSAAPRTSTATPARSAARPTRPTDLMNPYSTLTGRQAGADASPSTSSSGCRHPRCVDFLRDWTRRRHRASLQPEVANKVQEWLGDGGRKLADWDISRDRALLRHRDPRPAGGRAAKYFYVWLDAPIGYLAALKKLFDSGAAQALGRPQLRRSSWPTPQARAVSTSSARTSSTSTRCSGRRCSSSPSARRRTTSSCTDSSRFRREDVEIARHRHLARSATSSSGSIPSGCATTSRPSSTRTSRTSTSTPTISSRGSTATWSASTSTSPAAPRASSRATSMACWRPRPNPRTTAPIA